MTLSFFSSLRGIYYVFKYCIINNICLGPVLWSIFNVHHSLYSTSWISSKALSSPLLSQWQCPTRKMAGLRLLIHRREQKCSPRSAQESLLIKASWGSCKQVMCIFLKLNLVPEDAGSNSWMSHNIIWLHCLIQVTSITSSHTPLFICAISIIHWTAIVYQALCYVLGMCLTLCDLMDNPPVSSVLGILQARTLEWVAISSSGVSSRPRDWTHVSHDSCITRLIFLKSLRPPGKDWGAWCAAVLGVTKSQTWLSNWTQQQKSSMDLTILIGGRHRAVWFTLWSREVQGLFFKVCR